jgi:hypothetical protein
VRAFAHLRHELAQDIVIARGTLSGTLKNEFLNQRNPVYSFGGEK